MDDSARCPCLSGETYGACCGPLHAHVVPAPTAERLMRSRYSAFVVGDAAWLLETWHPSTRPDELELDPEVRWYRLDVLRTERGGPLDDRGVVEFAAHHRVDGRAEVQREVSRFVRDPSRRWLYVDGVPG
jgi:SEC-C motif-containing protein